MSDQACPACTGRRFLSDPTGLRFDHTVTCLLRAAEDSRHMADLDRTRERVRSFTRPVTPTETVLVASCGVTTTPTTCRVQVISPSVLHRSFVGSDGTLIDLDPTNPSED